MAFHSAHNTPSHTHAHDAHAMYMDARMDVLGVRCPELTGGRRDYDETHVAHGVDELCNVRCDGVVILTPIYR
ncbi:hypothetical protein Pmani_033452 [Petrolisthes manimaculis]|uniref:Uncharacterized protein n=1 Tax=Petrolisthes manimaculis TaxID=1843537 RepID=A0AAE1NQG4_9EUCA|nr:hypothetical protein Pmani_033452 [Petrolisthes manimaculis]